MCSLLCALAVEARCFARRLSQDLRKVRMSGADFERRTWSMFCDHFLDIVALPLASQRVLLYSSYLWRWLAQAQRKRPSLLSSTQRPILTRREGRRSGKQQHRVRVQSALEGSLVAQPVKRRPAQARASKRAGERQRGRAKSRGKQRAEIRLSSIADTRQGSCIGHSHSSHRIRSVVFARFWRSAQVTDSKASRLGGRRPEASCQWRAARHVQATSTSSLSFSCVLVARSQRNPCGFQRCLQNALKEGITRSNASSQRSFCWQWPISRVSAIYLCPEQGCL